MEAKRPNPAIFFKLLDTQVQLTLLYGAEIRGLCTDINTAKVALFALKRFLKTHNSTIHSKYGFIRCLLMHNYVKCIVYWEKLLIYLRIVYQEKV